MICRLDFLIFAGVHLPLSVHNLGNFFFSKFIEPTKKATGSDILGVLLWGQEMEIILAMTVVVKS